MTDPTSKMRWIAVAVVWIGVIFGVRMVYVYWWAPSQKQKAEEAKVEEHKQTIEKTSAPSRYTTSINFAADAFSGYAPIRSDMFRDECAKFGIRLDLSDDGANYTERLHRLADGKLDIAVFTIDALIKTSAEYGDLPATIVDLIDESKGADAATASWKMFPNIDSMNNRDVKIVCVPNSPSETLGRVFMAHFNLDRLGPEPFEFLDSAEAVYKRYVASKPEDKRVFITWEPYVSKICDNPDYHTLMDSSKVRGYFVDVIVARRGFLIKYEDIVTNVVKSYRTTLFANRSRMSDLVMDDARQLGQPLKKEQAERLVKVIWWKNTQEAFGHFGLTTGTGLQHMEEICRNITDVLIKTGGVKKDPTNGQPNMLYYDGVVRKLFDTNWHPGFGNESVRQEHSLMSLSEEEWEKLKPVGKLNVPRLVFARGTANLSSASEATLATLAEHLKLFPQYYLVVRGNAASDGDLEANLRLATLRAKTATDWLVEHGVDRNRIRAESAKPNGSTTVAFVLGELPY